MSGGRAGPNGGAASSTAIDDLPPFSPGRRLAVTVGVLTGTALAAVEATVVSAAMPTVVASLGGLEHYTWVFSSYLLASTVTVPLWGKLSDLYGRRRLYQAGILLFLAGSWLCGISGSMEQLVAARVLQGFGAGGLIPLGMTIIADVHDVGGRARVQGLFSSVWGLASVVGPPAGGYITEALSWRWVFFLNLPVGGVAATIIGLALREPRRTSRPSIDFLGAATFTAGLTALLFGLAGANDPRHLLEPGRLATLAAGAAFVATFVAVERRAVDPLVPPGLLRDPVVATAVVSGFLAGMAMFGAVSFVPLYAQGVLGTTPAGAGATLTALMLGWVTFSVVGGRLLLRVGPRHTILSGFFLLTAGFIALTLHRPDAWRGWLHAELGTIGAGLGLTMMTLVVAVQQVVPRERLGVSTSVAQLSRAIGGAAGVALMGLVLASALARGGPAGGVDLSALVRREARVALPVALRQDLQQALASALSRVFGLCALSSGLAFAVAWRWLPPGRVADGPPSH